jgi:predicted enzyme related to lactoylglutathione lyase
MLAQLRAVGAQVDDRVEDYDFGRFGWATDPDGNRFELWEPRSVYDHVVARSDFGVGLRKI